MNEFWYTIQFIISAIGGWLGYFLGGCDGLVFTAGLGENQPALREAVIDYLAFAGVTLNKEVNAVTRDTAFISADDSSIPVAVIATNEELAIARDTKSIVEKL